MPYGTRRVSTCAQIAELSVVAKNGLACIWASASVIAAAHSVNNYECVMMLPRVTALGLLQSSFLEMPIDERRSLPEHGALPSEVIQFTLKRSPSFGA